MKKKIIINKIPSKIRVCCMFERRYELLHFICIDPDLEHGKRGKT